MKLYTLLPEKAWLSLLQKGYLVCDEMSHSTMSDFQYAYDWMMEQMTLRIGPPPAEAELPVWAWYKYSEKRVKPQITSFGATKGEREYRVEIEADPNATLLSDFMNWEMVLVNWHLPGSLEDMLAFDDKFEAANPSPELQAEAQRVKRQSWQRIFNFEPAINFNGNYKAPTQIQACLWKIELSQVTKVQPYVSTGYKWKTIKPRFRCLHDKIQPPFDQYSEGNITIQYSSDQQP